jgi:carboxyl-terminal processing protease
MYARIALLLALSIPALTLAQSPAPESKAIDESAAEADAKPSDDGVPLDDIQRFVSVFRTVREAYVEGVTDRKLMHAALRGLLTDLDPHSAYLDKEQARDMDEFTNGAYDGVGVELVQQPDRSLRVIAPIDDTPAARAGLKPGDVIIAIDGEPVDVDNADAGRAQLRGAVGTKVLLRVVREGEPTPIEVTVVRDTIRVTSVRGRLLEPGYAYVRISTFQGETGGELRDIVSGLQKPKQPLRGLVLDLRSNPGGVLGAAVEVADAFLDKGLIVATKGRLPLANAQFNATRGDLLNGAPIVLLVDGGSASASEVLVGALRDHRRALVMGGRTFGKGSVQTVLPLDNGDAIKLTTARYYTPSGRSIQAHGIVPDVHLKSATGGGGEEAMPREADLPGHLRPSDSDDAVDDGSFATPETFDSEYAIGEALNLLKALDVFAKTLGGPGSAD